MTIKIIDRSNYRFFLKLPAIHQLFLLLFLSPKNFRILYLFMYTESQAPHSYFFFRQQWLYWVQHMF